MEDVIECQALTEIMNTLNVPASCLATRLCYFIHYYMWLLRKASRKHLPTRTLSTFSDEPMELKKCYKARFD